MILGGSARRQARGDVETKEGFETTQRRRPCLGNYGNRRNRKSEDEASTEFGALAKKIIGGGIGESTVRFRAPEIVSFQAVIS